MRRLWILSLAVMALMLVSCQQEKKVPQLQDVAERDSLEKIIAQKDNEINDMMGTLNEIQEGFREINEAENRVTIVKDGEGADKAQQIRENIQFISKTMKRNRALIEKLRTQLRQSSFKGDQLKATLDSMVKQLAEKDEQLKQLQSELDARDIHIAELDQTITGLNENVADLKTENTRKTETISTQEKQLNTAWYVFGTKKELRDQHILEGSKVLQANFNKSYFTKIDIRVDKVIPLYSKSVKVMTMHPSNSYTLQQDANKQYVLRITNPEIFWSTSKYLVILVK